MTVRAAAKEAAALPVKGGDGMTVKEIIETAQRLKPSQYTTDDMLRWFNDKEGRIFEVIIKTHEGAPEARERYTEETWDAQPFAAGPYEGLYLNWLFAQMDYHNAEEERYNNHILMHDELMGMFRAWYNQNHMPLTGPQIRNYRGW